MIFRIICGGVAISLIVYLICDFIQFSSKDGYGGCNQISFDRFVAFYNINPDRWELYDGYVQYAVPQTYKFSNGVEHTYIDKCISFHFNFKDRIKYKRWKSNRYKLKKQQEHFKEYQEVLECVKKDLEQFTRENDEMMKCETENYAKTIDEVPRMFEEKDRDLKLLADILDPWGEDFPIKGIHY